MLQIYVTPLSSAANKVLYLANYLNLPYEKHTINLSKGEQKQPAFLKINPYGRVPAINDNGFCLAESNAIIRYLADKHQSPVYPKDLQQRAMVDQWIDYASQHVMLALGKIMYNTHFYQSSGSPIDERSLEDGRKFIGIHLPNVENQLSQHSFVAGDSMTLADIVMLSALDVCEVCNVDLSSYKHIVAWRKKLMNEPFYRNLHENFAATFNQITGKTNATA